MNNEAKMSFLTQFPLFSALSPEERIELGSLMDYKVKSKYSFIYLPEDPSDMIYFLAFGAIFCWLAGIYYIVRND